MPDFANDKDFGAESLAEARKGIIDPHRREVDTSTILYRFGDSERKAWGGEWWLDEIQFKAVRRWADTQSLTLPLAARVLGAIAHSYGSMQVLVRARVAAPLLAHEGRSKNQSIRTGDGVAKRLGLQHLGDKIAEILNPEDVRSGPKIDQLFIPGLRDSGTNADSLTRLSARRFTVGAGHIGGVRGFPKNAKIQ